MSLDLATIGVGFDTSGLAKGTAALKDTEKQAMRTADAADTASKGFAGMGASSDKARTATEKMTQGINDQIKKLQDQVSTFGMSARQTELYRLATEGATKAQLAQVEALQKQVAGLERAGEIGTRVGGLIKAGAVLAAAAVVGAAVAFEKLIGNVAKYQDLAERTGGDAAGLASLRTAADVGGTSVESMVMAVNRLQLSLSKVDDESKGAGKALAAIGLNIEDFKKLKADEQLREIGKALNQFADGGGKVAVVQTLMGRGASAMLPAFKELGNEQERINLLTNEQIRAADDYKDAQARAKSELLQTVEALAVSALPVLTEFIKALKDTASELFNVNSEAKSLSSSSHVRDFASSAGMMLAEMADAAFAVAQSVRVIGHSFGVAAAMIAAIGRHDLMGANAIFNAARQSGDAMKFNLGLADKLEKRLDAVNTKATAAAAKFKDPRILGPVGSIEDQAKKNLEYSASTPPKKPGAAKADPEIKRAYDEAISQLKSYADESKFISSELVKDLESLRKRDVVNDYEYHDRKSALALAGVADQRAFVEQEIAIAKASKLPLLERQKAIEAFQKTLQDLNQAKRAIDAESVRQENETNAKVGAAIDKRLEDMERGTKTLLDEQKALRQEREEFGLTEQQLNALRIARAEEMAVALERQAVTRESIDLTGAESAELRKQAALTRDNAKARVDNTGVKQMQDQWKDFYTDIQRGLTDSLFRAFESGKGFFRTLWDGIKNLFKTTVLKLAINGVVGGIMGTAAGGAAAGGLLEKGSGLLGMAGNASSLLNMATGGGFSGAVGLGTAFTGGFSSGAAGLSTLVSMNATTGAAVGGATQMAAGAGNFLGAMGPAGWIALAALAAYAIFSKEGGGPKTASGGGYGIGPGETIAGPAADYAKGLETGYATLAKQLGLTGKLSVGAFTSQDLMGDAMTQVQVGAALNGREVYSRIDRTGSMENVVRGDQGLKDVLAEETTRVMFAALQASDLPAKYKTYLDAMTGSAASMAAAINEVIVFKQVSDGLDKTPFAAFRDLTYEAATALIAANGGFENLIANLGSYYENFFSAEEKRAKLVTAITDRLNAAGAKLTELDVSTATRAQFRALAESAKSSPELVAALIAVNQQFVSITTEAAGASSALGGLSDSLKGIDQIRTAAGAVNAALRSIGEAVEGFADAARSAMAGVGNARKGISDALFAAEDAQTAAQERINDIVRGRMKTIDDFLNELSGTSSTESLTSLKARLSATSVLAAGGDSQAQANLIQQAQAVIKAAEAGSTSRADFARTESFVRSQLLMVRGAGAQFLDKAPGGKTEPLGDFEAARAGLKQATDNAAALLALAVTTGSNTNRILQDTAGSITSLSSAYYQALTASTTAQSDYSAVLLATQNLQLTTGNKFSGLNTSLADLTAANTDLFNSMVLAIGASETLDDEIAAMFGLTGTAATTLAGLLADPGTAATTLATLLAGPGANSVASVFGVLIGDLKGFSTAIRALSGGPVSTGVVPTTSGASAADIQSFAKAQSWDSAGDLAIYNKAIERGVTSSQIDAALGLAPGTANAKALALGLPAFANGGDHTGGWAMVGERGPELAYMPPARIYSAEQTRSMGRGDNSELVAEIRELRKEVAGLRKAGEDTAKNTESTNKTLNTVTRGGRAIQTEAFV